MLTFVGADPFFFHRIPPWSKVERRLTIGPKIYMYFKRIAWQPKAVFPFTWAQL
ncbi:hypothetical protein DSM3645_04675 [Blastopirellula marina DSM 3645]|uniref:Uncharacterized protein n=1 Tax=Blastopirellula marina DSM 3645 TaxID=314230 RepID=A4A1L1_9BACT|nr:hypothetical protein DSM3645_04675 [Blastopirellula marina DSM 3645]